MNNAPLFRNNAPLFRIIAVIIMKNAPLFMKNTSLFRIIVVIIMKNTSLFMNNASLFMNNTSLFRIIVVIIMKNTSLFKNNATSFRKDLTTPDKVDSYPSIPEPTNTRTPKTDSTMLPRDLIRQRVYPTKCKLSKQNAVNVKNSFYLWSGN